MLVPRTKQLAEPLLLPPPAFRPPPSPFPCPCPCPLSWPRPHPQPRPPSPSPCAMELAGNAVMPSTLNAASLAPVLAASFNAWRRAKSVEGLFDWLDIEDLLTTVS